MFIPSSSFLSPSSYGVLYAPSRSGMSGYPCPSSPAAVGTVVSLLRPCPFVSICVRDSSRSQVRGVSVAVMPAGVKSNCNAEIQRDDPQF